MERQRKQMENTGKSNGKKATGTKSELHFITFVTYEVALASRRHIRFTHFSILL